MKSTATAARPVPASGVTEGNATDFQELYETHSKPVFYLALRLLGDPTRAEDAMQDVFLKAFRAMAAFRHEASIRTWLYRITINHCQNLMGTWHHRHIRPTANGEVPEPPACESRTPLVVAEAKELGRRIQRSLEAISEEYRLLLLLVADEELSYESIGELTHQTSDSVRGKLYRARKAFAYAFNKTPFD